uniref:THIF-type NAD/FAD binding fold domain-containing protein n=1 Tax=Chromera velia CCMP2878 TaxID=1169474 RepID=A0A0G4G827_9ALVE|eukprot:Cvel_20730.t1-p1 / transcript=Cvel_20730.t1 / gene=Cvel_20730 / organism=Chromera_velia_CCMP2878 / gene_product=NEDD8-activating enzyme E1 regulatory subunit, putative / transcript_product=NEDD8-activating enzyme E1 regulatory subunit, putative / location=Cvel_scaffold1887:28389-30029(-) / protein_length=547 / sequence_SO=supercontig / SO=protein_coding / is_pseudo=false
MVDHTDLCDNFFVTQDSVGRSRAEVATALLLEMNPDVAGQAIKGAPSAYVQKLCEEPALLKQYALVIASQLDLTSAISLGNVCHKYDVPLMWLRASGLMGAIRTSVRCHCVVETKGDREIRDLRITEPFSELAAYCKEKNLDEMENMDHGHVPWLVLHIKALEIFQAHHGGEEGRIPKTRAEKDEFKNILRGMRRKEGEMNFEEALDNHFVSYSKYEVPDGIGKVLDCVADKSALFRLKEEGALTPFWLVAAALSRFKNATQGKLPLSGRIPDMHADTQSFVGLQQTFAARAQGDMSAIYAHLDEIAFELGESARMNHQNPFVSKEYVENFCKNALQAEVFGTRSIEEEYSVESYAGEGSGEEAREAFAEALGDDSSTVSTYLAFWAAERFRTRQGRFPGDLSVYPPGQEHEESLLEEDKNEVMKELREILSHLMVEEEMLNRPFGVVEGDGEEGEANGAADPDSMQDTGEGVPAETPQKYLEKAVREVVRGGGAEIHVTAAYFGGVASQEAVKLITRQYQPVLGTFAWDGNFPRGSVVDFLRPAVP